MLAHEQSMFDSNVALFKRQLIKKAKPEPVATSDVFEMGDTRPQARN